MSISLYSSVFAEAGRAGIPPAEDEVDDDWRWRGNSVRK